MSVAFACCLKLLVRHEGRIVGGASLRLLLVVP